MLMHEVSDRLRALLLGACCVLPLAGCKPAAADAQSGDAASSAPLSLAERDARHFEHYIRYRAGFDRPRRLISDALQDDVEVTRVALQFAPGEEVICSSRSIAGD